MATKQQEQVQVPLYLKVWLTPKCHVAASIGLTTGGVIGFIMGLLGG